MADQGARKIISPQAVLLFTALATGCGGNATPTSPSGPGNSEVVGLDVSCPATLLVGEQGPCVAVARLRSGQATAVSPSAVWSSTQPTVVSVDAIGTIQGRSGGQAVISARYEGRDGNTVEINVVEQDALRVRAAIDQGDFRRGSAVTMSLLGSYSVASADTGSLSLVISDQEGTITTTPPSTVSRGGSSFLLSSNFVIPQRSDRICRTAILEVGSVTVAEPTSHALELRCITVRP